MPLLDFDSKSSVASKFNFLDLNLADKSNERGDESSGLQALHLHKTGRENFRSSEASRLVIEPTQLKPILVLKTALRSGQKLFINVVDFADSEHPAAALLGAPQSTDTQVWISDMRQDKDKMGSACSVITALPLHTLPLGQDELKTTALIKSIMSLGITILDPNKFSMPKMQKKGDLQQVSIPRAMIETLAHCKGAGNLITELDTAEDSTPKLGPQRSLHSISKFSSAIIKSPLPTLFTHQFSLPLESSGCSWSIYFDAKDSTLKILVPPSEEFIQIHVSCDDFRAFTRHSILYVFYSG